MRKVVFRLTPSLRSFSRNRSVFQVDFISNDNKLEKIIKKMLYGFIKNLPGNYLGL